MARFNWRTAEPERLIGTAIPIPPRDFGSGVVTEIKFGRFGLLSYNAAARAQIPWPKGLITPDERWAYDVPRVGHPLTVALLEDAVKRMARWVRESAGGAHAAHQRGHIVTSGFYRPLGTTWGEGDFEDPRGVIDASDALGHWYMAIDISRTATGLTWSPAIPKDVVSRILREVGLATPFAGEPWHHRPDRTKRDGWKE